MKHMSKLHWIFSTFPVAVARWWYWNTLCTSGFGDDVMFFIASAVQVQWFTRGSNGLVGESDVYMVGSLQTANNTGFVQTVKYCFPGLSRTCKDQIPGFSRTHNTRSQRIFRINSVHKHGCIRSKKCTYQISYQCNCITENKPKCNNWNSNRPKR